MKKLLVFLVATLVLVEAKRDWSKIFIRRPTAVASANPRLIPNKPGLNITNGDESVPHSRPWQVALFLPTPEGTGFCGGSLIDEKTVLTAAHCVEDVIGEIEIVLGAHNIREDEPSQIPVFSRDFVRHEKYDPDYIYNDIAVIRLSSAVQLNENIQTIQLANGTDDYLEEEAIVSGWGRYSDSVDSISSVLREVTLPVISNKQCALYYGSTLLRSGYLCVDARHGKSTCDGDSGGPLVHDGVQIGVVSFGVIYGCEVGYPAVFARATEYSDWINRHRAQ